jgi:hypothetical protein
MNDLLAGWAPASQVRRRVVLPEWLDREVNNLAQERDENPASFVKAVLAKALGHAHGDAAQCFHPQSAAPNGLSSTGKTSENGTARRVQRTLLLDPTVNDALNACAYSSKLEPSELTIGILRHMLTMNGRSSVSGEASPSGEESKNAHP